MTTKPALNLPGYVDGIDVSAVQRIDDADAVYAAGFRFALTKVAEGAAYCDPRAAESLARLRGAGLLCGTYRGTMLRHLGRLIDVPAERETLSFLGTRRAADLFVEANQPPPAKVTETPGQAEALPEPGPEVTEAREASEAKPGQECAGVIVRPGHPPVSVRWRLDGDVVHVTVAVPGRIDSVSTAVTVGGVKP